MTDDAWERLQLVFQISCELADLQGLGREVVLGSTLHRRALEREIEIIGEACRQLEQDSPDIAQDLEARLPQVRWKGWRGLRNNVAHNLLNLDHEILWDAAVDGAPTIRHALEHEYGDAIVHTWAGAPPPTLAATAEPTSRDSPQSSRTESPGASPAQLRLWLMYEVAGELEPLAALGPARILEPGILRRAAERHVELTGEAWIQLENRFPNVAEDVTQRFPEVDWRGWRAHRNTVAKNVVHSDSPGLWRAVAKDASALHAALGGEFATRPPDRHPRPRLQYGAPALSRRRNQADRFGGHEIGD